MNGKCLGQKEDNFKWCFRRIGMPWHSHAVSKWSGGFENSSGNLIYLRNVLSH